jgi:hypothetical protein
LSVLVIPSLAGTQPAGSPASLLAEGIGLIHEGHFQAGQAALQTAADLLAGKEERQAELATAFAYLGVAAMARGSKKAARARFRAVSDPRRVSFNVVEGLLGGYICLLHFEGKVDAAAISSMSGTLTCEWCDECDGEVMQATFVRE